MSRSPRQRRIAAAAATRRWRRSQTKGIQLVTVEVSEVRLAQLVAERLVPAATIEDSYDSAPCSVRSSQGVAKHVAA